MVVNKITMIIAGPQANECTLILTEGDSAKALAVAGLSVLGRDRFGVFPLKVFICILKDSCAYFIV
jgi:DNA topoisomerase-2